jgi:NADPH-ferrihemoprotein reductase
MNELGGTRLLEHGEGDDDGSMEDDFSSWKASFWARTKMTFGLQNESAAATQFKPSFSIDWKPAEQAAKYIGGLTPSICDPKHKPILANVVVNRELRTDVQEGEKTNKEGESTRHMDLDVSALRLSYVTADDLGVCPRNDYKAVAQMIARLKVKGDSVFTLKALGKRKPPVPTLCSIQDALLWYLDFQAIPRASVLTILSQYTQDEIEKAKLHQWTHEGKEEFQKDEKSILEVLEELPNTSVPFLDFLEFCPKLQPRFYTISSSSLVAPKQVSITVALSTHQKPRGRVYHGIATTYLCSLKPGKDQVCVFLRPSSFRLPKPKRVFINGSPTPEGTGGPSQASQTATLPPIIMVGPGTGVAPFRAFVQEFQYLRSKSLPSFPSTHLFFGCRNREQDYIYQEEFKAAIENESLTTLHAAFSRETNQKVYVQSDLKANAETIWQLLSQQRAYFYVCGGTIMGRQVKEVVHHIVEQHGNMTPQAAMEYVRTHDMLVPDLGWRVALCSR